MFFLTSRKKGFAIVEERADESASLLADSFRPAHPGRSEILNYDMSKIKCFHLKSVRISSNFKLYCLSFCERSAFLILQIYGVTVVKPQKMAFRKKGVYKVQGFELFSEKGCL